MKGTDAHGEVELDPLDGVARRADGDVPVCDVEDVIITAELDRRPSRAPELHAENRALASLAEAMGSASDDVLQRMVEAVMELTRCDSAGVSLLEPGGDQGTFRWVATAGAWAPYRDGTMPRERSPCGEVVAREAVLLVKEPQRAFPALLQAEPGIGEGLLVPFGIDGVPAGTVWAIMHGPDRRFEAEDARLLQSLARFASAAHRMTSALRGAQANERRVLHDSERRQAFLLELVDRLRGLTEPRDVMTAVAEMLGRHLHVDRVGYGEISDDGHRVTFRTGRADGVDPLIGTFPTDDLGVGTLAELRCGRTMAYADVKADDRITGLGSARMEARAVMAVPLVREGRLSAILYVDHREVRAWSSEEVALVEEVAERICATVDRARAEAALAASEEKYRSLFDAIDEGLVEIEMVTDDDGRIVDWRWLAHNASFERVSGLKGVKGRLFSEVLPDLEPEWAERYGHVVATGEAARFELPVARLDSWFDVFVSRIGGEGSRRLAVIFNDITRRKDVESALRASDERQEFLLKLADALRPLKEPVAVQEEAMRLLGEHLKVSRAFYSEVSADGDVFNPGRGYDDGVAPMPARLRLSDFGDELGADLLAGRRMVVDDALADPRFAADAAFERLELRAGIGVPLVGQGRLLAIVSVHQSVPREWTALEISLVDETAERIWTEVERARVEVKLRDSEARLKAAFESVPVGVAVVDPSGTATFSNAEFRRFLPTGVVPSRDAERGARWRGWDPLGLPLTPKDFPAARAMRGESVVPGQEMLYTDDDGRDVWTNVATVPIVDDQGRVTGLVTAIADIDVAKRAERAVADSEARFRQFSDASTSILWIRDAGTLRMMFASPAFDAIYGIPGPDRGGDPGLRAWLELIEPGDRRNVLAHFRRVRAGERIEMGFRIRRASDGALRWIHNTDFPLRDAAGRVRWIAGLGADVTDAKEAANLQGVLVAELQHRTRNLIAVVRSLSDRTLGNASSLDDFGSRFRLRLAALSRVQGLLSQLMVGERVAFDELLRSELNAHGAADEVGGKVTLVGPLDVPLRSGSVQTFALALHELATNAVKYGALAAPGGRLAVRWHVEPGTDDDPPRLHVDWRESGVVMPRAGDPSRGGGYGRELIERALPYQLKAKTSYLFGSDGVHCTIAVPISTGAAGGGGGGSDDG